jgi:hypothetical protein
MTSSTQLSARTISRHVMIPCTSRVELQPYMHSKLLYTRCCTGVGRPVIRLISSSASHPRTGPLRLIALPLLEQGHMGVAAAVSKLHPSCTHIRELEYTFDGLVAYDEMAICTHKGINLEPTVRCWGNSHVAVETGFLGDEALCKKKWPNLRLPPGGLLSSALLCLYRL